MKPANELSQVKEMAQEASAIRQQLEEKLKSSEPRSRATDDKMQSSKEDNIKLSRRLGKSKRETTVALRAFQRCGVVVDGSIPATATEDT